MRMLRYWLLGLCLPWAMAGWAAAQVVQGAEDTPVDRVIKAAQEIRLDEQRPLDLQPRPKSNDSVFYFGGQLANLTGDARPDQMLVNQVPAFADGPQVSSDVRVEAYRLGYRLPIASGQGVDAVLPVSVHSVMGIAVVDATYQRETEGMTVEQGLLKGAPLLGLDTEWPVSRRFSLAGESSATVPIQNMPWIFSAQLLGRYRLSGRGDDGMRAFGGLGYQRISFQEQADVVSDFRLDSGPLLIIGIEARF
jgi:hypothetical protein